MGWASGSELCEDICKVVKGFVDKSDYEEVSATICGMFVENDADDFELYIGTPYWNYLKLYSQDEFLSYCKEWIEEHEHSVEELRSELSNFKYEGFNILLRKWLVETFQTEEEHNEHEYDYLDELFAETQAERDEELLWGYSFNV